MPTVTGNLSDFGLQSLAAYSPEVRFVPSSVAVEGPRLLATRPVVATPDARGFFAVTLASNEAMTPATWYELQIVWLEPGDGSGYAAADFPDLRLHVPITGGAIANLLRVPATNALLVAFQPTEPDPWPVGLTWVNSVTGDLIRKDS